MSSLPAYGERLLSGVLDEIAATDPDRELYTIPKNSDFNDGFQTITARRFANAVNRAAWHLEKCFGKAEKEREFETIGYIGPNDLAYFILILASNKASYKMLFSQPGNSLPGHSNLITATSCTRWLIPEPPPKDDAATNTPPRINVDHILAIHPMTTATIPDIHSLLDPMPVPSYPCTKSFEQARNDPFVVIHTSGSTGLPKPIFLTHASMSHVDTMNLTSHSTPPRRSIDGLSMEREESAFWIATLSFWQYICGVGDESFGGCEGGSVVCGEAFDCE